MLSAPPASAKSASPSASACTAETTACAPDPQSRLTFIAGTVSGMPASIAATRRRYMSRGSVLMTWPKTTWPIWPGSTPARSIAACGRDRAQLDRRGAGEAAAEGADGGPRAAEDDDVGHGLSSRMSVRSIAAAGRRATARTPRAPRHRRRVGVAGAGKRRQPMSRFLDDIAGRLDEIRAEGLWKTEREIDGAAGRPGRRSPGARC